MNTDCLTLVLSYLDINDIVRCTLINQQFSRLFNEQLWFKLCNRDYPEYYDGLKRDTYRDTYILCYGLNELKKVSNNVITIDDLYRGTSIIVGTGKLCNSTTIIAASDRGSSTYDTTRFSINICKLIDKVKLLKSVTELQNINHRSIPTWIGDMINLRTVTLDHNNIASFPVDLCRLTNLEELSIGFNKLECLPGEIEHMVSLKRLYIHHNMLSILPSEICKLINLNTLAMEFNYLTEFHPEIGDLVNLQYLSFNSNFIKHLPIEISKLKKLKILSGLSNFITTVPLEISSIPNLQIYH